MAMYICKLGAPDGKILTREYEAEEPLGLRRELEEQGYHIFDVRKRSVRFFHGRGFGRGSVKRRDLILLNQEMLVLIKAGLPIVQVIDTVLEQYTIGPLSNALKQVKEDVKGGAALSTALEKHRQIFPSLYTASIRAGESTGDLPVTIQRYISYLRKLETIRKKIISALLYPSILVVVSILAIGLLLFYVIPILSNVFTESGSQLPLLTRMMISFASFVKYLLCIPFPGGDIDSLLVDFFGRIQHMSYLKIRQSCRVITPVGFFQALRITNTCRLVTSVEKLCPVFENLGLSTKGIRITEHCLFVFSRIFQTLAGVEGSSRGTAQQAGDYTTCYEKIHQRTHSFNSSGGDPAFGPGLTGYHIARSGSFSINGMMTSSSVPTTFRIRT